MRPTTAAWLALAAAAALLGSRDLAAQRAARPLADAGGLWISDAAIDDARRMMIVVDPATRHAAVYHVDAATGALTLRSTRDITWDLLVDAGAVVGVHPPPQHVEGAGEHRSLADTQRNARRDERGERQLRRDGGEQGEQRPPDHRRPQHATPAVAVGQPAGADLQEQVPHEE